MLDQKDVQGTAWYRAVTSPAALREAVTPIERLRDMVAVGWPPGSELVEISAEMDLPQDPPAIVNAITSSAGQGCSVISRRRNHAARMRRRPRPRRKGVKRARLT